MRNVKLAAAIVAIVLSGMGGGALAQAPAAKPEAASSEPAFKGVVVSMSPMGLTAKGEFSPPSDAGGTGAARSVTFLLKGAKFFRDGWRPCEAKDVQKGETVSVAYTQTTRGRPKFIATRIDVKGKTSVTDTEPIMAKAGKVLLVDDFSREQMAPKWRPGKGFWEIHDGIVTAAENPDDHHGAYAYADPHFAYKDIVAEFSFKFDGSTGCHFMMEDSNYKGAHAGHIIRATITPTTAQLADSKFGSMKNEIHDKMVDPNTTDQEKKELQASIKDKSAAFKITLEADKWHQARVEVVGDEMLLSIDNQPVAYIKSEGVDHPTKNMVGFTVAGKSTQLDNVRVWEATASDDWSKNRTAIQAVLKKL